jgi:hypothetical protein
MQLIRVNANVPWTIAQGKHGAWIGTCEPLKLTVQADTWANLMEDIGLTLNAVLQDLLRSDELPQFLRDRGWQLVGPMPSRPEEVRFDVPFFPAMMGANGPQRELHQ